MPRAFSSGRRSVSTPVSARTSVVLPWSIWPAVATIMRELLRARACKLMRRMPASSLRGSAGRARNAPSAMRPITGHRQRAERSRRCAGARALCRSPSCDRDAGARQRLDRQRAAADLARASRRRAPRAASPSARCDGGQRRAAACCSMSVGGAREQRATSAAARAAARDRAYSCSTASSAASVILSTRSARFIGFFSILAMRSSRPTMSPACGPPSSLSPLNVTMSAPCRDRFAHRRLVRQAPLRQIDERAAAEIDDERHARSCASCCEFGFSALRCVKPLIA